jgi:steroid delta-isomerase-like uncharacterized protein
MAEKENVELAKLQIAALNSRDLESYVSRFAESYVGHSELAPGPILGRAGVRQNVENIFRAFPDLRLEVEQTIASGDSVAVRFVARGTHQGNFAGVAPTNKSIELHACNVIEVSNGKVIRGRLYADNATMFQQIGVFSLPRATAAG